METHIRWIWKCGCGARGGSAKSPWVAGAGLNAHKNMHFRRSQTARIHKTEDVQQHGQLVQRRGWTEPR